MGTLDDLKASMAALAAAQSIPPASRAAIGQAALDSQRVRLSEPYYSAVSFEFAIAAGPPVVYTIPKGNQAVAFGYALNENPNTGGFVAFGAAGINAALDMTNIREKGKPNAGETLLVYGMSIQPWEDSDGFLAKLVWTNTSVVRIMNGGKQRYEMGRMSFAPGAGGLTGNSASFVNNLTADHGQRPDGALANGLQGRDNFYAFAEPWYWRPAGNADTDLNIVFLTERAISFTSTPVAANTPAGAFNLAFVPPTVAASVGTYVRASVLLWSIQDAARSVNQ
jgi:hypothetical protein